MFTNPAMYNRIRKQKTTLQLYTERLVADGLIPEGEIEQMKAAFQAKLNEEYEAGKNFRPNKADWLDGRWKNMQTKDLENYQRGETWIKPETLAEIGAALTACPKGSKSTRPWPASWKPRPRCSKPARGFDWPPPRRWPSAACRSKASGPPGRPGLHPRHLLAPPFRLIDQQTEERYYAEPHPPRPGAV